MSSDSIFIRFSFDFHSGFIGIYSYLSAQLTVNTVHDQLVKSTLISQEEKDSVVEFFLEIDVGLHRLEGG